MHKITIVEFIAFDKPSKLGFIDETPEGVQHKVKEICSTAVIKKITCYTGTLEIESETQF